MTPEQEDELIEKAARAMCAEMQPSKDPDELGPAPRGTLGLLPFWYRGYGRQASAALSIAKPIIRNEALRIASDICRGRALKWAKDEFHEDAKTAQRARTSYAEADRCAADIDALKSKGQKP